MREESTASWCWFQEPRVLATETATYIGWTEFDEDGTISVARYDHEDERFTVNRGIGATPALAPDDHNAPALTERPDGRIEVWYTAHNADDGNRYRVSDLPDAIDAFGEERTVPEENQSTYPMPIWLPEERWYFYRDRPGPDTPSTFYYYRSEDGGETWIDRTRLFDISGDDYSGYIKVSPGPERIDVCYSRHPRPAPLERCDVRHCYYDVAAGEWRDSHGEPQSLPLAETDMTRIHDAADSGRRGWIWDVQTHPAGPAIVYISYPDGDPADQRYHHARYRDGEWRVLELADTDHLYATNSTETINEREYAPGITLGQIEGPDVVYLSRNTGPRPDKRLGLDLERWEVDHDNEATTRTDVIATGEETNQFRPVTPRTVAEDAIDCPVRAVWMADQAGAPYHYHDETETIQFVARIETDEGPTSLPMAEWTD